MFFFHRIFLAIAISCVGVAALFAQYDDYRTLEHAPTGLRYKYPQDFKSVPTQPTEKLVIGRFGREEPYNGRKVDKHRRPESFAVFALQPNVTGTSRPTGDAKTAEEHFERLNRITSWKEFLATRYPGLETKPLDPNAKKTDDKPYEEYEVKGPRTGYLYIREVGGRTVGVLGFADKEVMDVMTRRFRLVGQSIAKLEGADRKSDEALAFYDGKNFRDPIFRADARRAMLKQWKAKDTENFFIVYHTDNTKLINQVAGDLEAIRPLYQKYFPAKKPIEAVSVVRICKDLDEYHKYGGPAGSGGYWNWVAKELVLFDYSAVPPSAVTQSRHMSEKDSYIVLYHEAFHQYIYYAAGQISPHSWFNEGLGDVFSGTVIYDDSFKVKEVGPSRWRVNVVKDAEAGDKWIPLKELIKAEQHEYYNRAKVSVMYAEGWAFCYFLMIAKDGGQKNAQWAAIIPNYYESLKAAYEKRMNLLDSSSSIGDRQKAEKDARDEALEKTFKDIDLEALETAWRSWIKKTIDPWAAQRKS